MNPRTTEASVVLNGRIVRAADVRVSPLGEGFMYGLGVFETLKVSRGQPVFFAEHFERLRRGALEIGLAFAAIADDLAARCRACIAANQLADAGLKIVVFQDVGRVGELILPRSGAPAAEVYARGFRLKSMPDSGRDSHLAGLKTLNYLKCLRARRAAQQAGFDEALFVARDGAVLEAAFSNIFVVRAGIVQTPPLTEGILPGIARAAVLRTAAVEVCETVVPRALLLDAVEVFITNSLLGVMPVAAVDGKTFNMANNPITRAIGEAFRALEAASSAAR